jgi:hypothetical protein
MCGICLRFAQRLAREISGSDYSEKISQLNFSFEEWWADFFWWAVILGDRNQR